MSIRVCCQCRRQIQGEGSQCRAFGPTIARRGDESTGFCYPCFAASYGKIDEQPREVRHAD